jgi:NAD(P)-dependent dehydrogenase (short-subunit alcohol dehydrogenase family)
MSTTTTPTTGVIVTGGASGIGLASARALAAVGRPVALWDLQADKAEAEAAAIAATYGVATIGLAVDVCDTAAIGAALAASRTALGTIGGLVHAAGTVDPSGVEGITVEAWDRVLDVNLRAHAVLVNALLADLEANPGSAVVGISSMDGVVAHAAIPSYCASKAGLLGLTRSLALALAPKGIRVNALCPGYIVTPMLLPDGSEERAAAMAATVPMGRLAQPEEMGSIVRFLMSEDASYVTGTQIVADGGFTSA